MSNSQHSARNMLDRLRALPAAQNNIIPTLQAYGGLQAFAARNQRSVKSLGRVGSLEVRLAQSAAEVRQAQKLRYRVFYQEGSAAPNPARLLARRDFDAYDAFCDHLLVIDHSAHRPAVVGTYRLLRQPVAENYGGFYTAGEFDIAPLLTRHNNLQFLELGRSCVLAPYRNKRTVELLWHGIRAYVQENGCDVLIGCASLDGTDAEGLSLPLSFLHYCARAPEIWQARALSHRYIEMNRMPKEAVNSKEALHSLPPLLKGYLRLGAYIGDGAVIDHAFGTTDVLVILPWSVIQKRYFDHFELSRRAA